ncbi:hypothetical protein [Lacticaseibacillus songhuajiangensis]|uniref:hypothetical protein n=1 Tax=Lacticaseibacillus songhuajiangensis TaxID=1296539 RepID=UPI000F7AF79A|nr:hypothetical protein [Lacticaseibacillus songhuajiangensis]
MHILMYGCLIAALILVIGFNLQTRRVVRRYPSQVVDANLAPSEKWRVNLLLQTRLAKFSPQVYLQNRNLGFWMFAFCGTTFASLALLAGTVQATVIAPVWPLLMGISAIGFGVTRIKLYGAQLVGWQQLLQNAPEQAQQWQLDQVELTQVQARVQALTRLQYLLIAVLLLLAVSFELAILTLLTW